MPSAREVAPKKRVKAGRSPGDRAAAPHRAVELLPPVGYLAPTLPDTVADEVCEEQLTYERRIQKPVKARLALYPDLL